MALVGGWFVPLTCPCLDMFRAQTGASKYHLVKNVCFETGSYSVSVAGNVRDGVLQPWLLKDLGVY